MKTRCEFNPEHYREILDRALQAFTITNFANHAAARDGSKPLIILRHDLDSGLPMAMEMASLERKLNISATYFVQLHSDFYSAQSLSGSRYLRKLSELGHEIGLHYDPTYYQAVGWDFRTGIERDLEILSNIVEEEVISVSQHLPILNDQEMEYPPQVHYDAYDPKYINGQFKYLSDSNGIFREGCFCQHLAKQRDYCFLVHPIWWVNEGQNWMEKLRHQIRKDCRTVKEAIEAKIAQYEKIISSRMEHDAKFQDSIKRKRNQ